MVVRSPAARARWLFVMSIILAGVGGCYTASVVSRTDYVQKRLSKVDVAGLEPATIFDALKVSWSLPPEWQRLPLTRNALYTHQQYRSESKRTATGVAYMRLPVPLSSKTVAWLASREYSKKSADGQLIGRWSDGAGREWFEAENAKYHVKGYVVTRGTEAWINYWGYRRHEPQQSAEIALATKSLESVVPLP